ncbi:hypothetical protein JHK87_057175 [Glycine soja]|nr:hypothetical protein JHK87_057175 [Glycine soja]
MSSIDLLSSYSYFEIPKFNDYCGVDLKDLYLNATNYSPVAACRRLTLPLAVAELHLLHRCVEPHRPRCLSRPLHHVDAPHGNCAGLARGEAQLHTPPHKAPPPCARLAIPHVRDLMRRGVRACLASEGSSPTTLLLLAAPNWRMLLDIEKEELYKVLRVGNDDGAMVQCRAATLAGAERRS